MRIARVFPRRTRATPTDGMAFVGMPTMFVEADEVHISVAFTWDMPEAERLAKEWATVAPVKIGGPGAGMAGGFFTPGMYLKDGYVITSRGCPNRCWFCSVPNREGNIRELPILPGWNVLDDNLLACSEEHIKAVFSMLERQERAVEFTGGLEAARLRLWHVDYIRNLILGQMFFAYDGPEDRDPLHAAGELLLANGFTTSTGKASHKLRAYVLIGYPKDTFEDAEVRLRDCLSAGFFPMAMLYRDKKGERDPKWIHFQRLWARPHIVGVAEAYGVVR